MFRFLPPAIKPTLTALTLALSAFSLNAQATLTNYTVNDTDLVYSSISDVTWTKDANLLGTWIASSADADGNGVKDIIDAIIKVNSTINSGSLVYITASDFLNDGRTSWFGAVAYVNYLNSIQYGGSNSWYLPTVVHTALNSKATNGTATGDELMELFYSELLGRTTQNIPNTETFDNEQISNYWSGTGYAPNLGSAYAFSTINGQQSYYNKTSRFFYTWAVTAGTIAEVSAVPSPAAAWLFATGLPVVGAVVRRRKQQA